MDNDVKKMSCDSNCHHKDFELSLPFSMMCSQSKHAPFTAGDIGEWQPDGSMKIIDRKKNIFKLSQGEYVAVENLENIFCQTPGVDSVPLKSNLHFCSVVSKSFP
jgi:acyl-CoA synthetase (AMP-forming)/AMP-acid ligase II